MGKSIYRSKENRVICGVCSGFAEYLDLDPTIVRIIWVLTSLSWGIGVIAYIVCAIIIPERSDFFNNEVSDKNYSNPSANSDSNNNRLALGIALIAIGTILIVKKVFSWFDFFNIWPILLIAAGIYILVRRKDEN